MTTQIAPDAALIVIDVQREFENPIFGRRDNPEAEQNIAALAKAWAAAGRPIVRVRQSEQDSSGPFKPGTPGHEFKPEAAAIEPALDVTKEVHSAFHGTPDLHSWLAERGIEQVAICGIQTNRCCESTARVAADLAYDVIFVIDAMHTFDKAGPDGVVLPAEQLATATATSLHGYFATVVRAADLLA